LSGAWSSEEWDAEIKRRVDADAAAAFREEMLGGWRDPEPGPFGRPPGGWDRRGADPSLVRLLRGTLAAELCARLRDSLPSFAGHGLAPEATRVDPRNRRPLVRLAWSPPAGGPCAFADLRHLDFMPEADRARGRFVGGVEAWDGGSRGPIDLHGPDFPTFARMVEASLRGRDGEALELARGLRRGSAAPPAAPAPPPHPSPARPRPRRIEG